ncbi:MAG: hypothetical protein ACFCD0_00150 [Gemmataceae bacterium]
MQAFQVRAMDDFKQRDPKVNELFRKHKETVKGEVKEKKPKKGNNRDLAKYVKEEALKRTHKEIGESQELAPLQSRYDNFLQKRRS